MHPLWLVGFDEKLLFVSVTIVSLNCLLRIDTPLLVFHGLLMNQHPGANSADLYASQNTNIRLNIEYYLANYMQILLDTNKRHLFMHT